MLVFVKTAIIVLSNPWKAFGIALRCCCWRFGWNLVLGLKFILGWGWVYIYIYIYTDWLCYQPRENPLTLHWEFQWFILFLSDFGHGVILLSHFESTTQQLDWRRPPARAWKILSRQIVQVSSMSWPFLWTECVQIQLYTVLIIGHSGFGSDSDVNLSKPRTESLARPSQQPPP